MTEEVKVAIGADNSQLLRALQESKSAMSEFFETITEKAGGVGEQFDKVHEQFSHAFQFTGLALATEAIHKIGETIEQMGAKAIQTLSTADVLGVTTDQMQAMQQAAEEAGVGQDQLTHAAERLSSVLIEARNGSSEAIDKLLKLGVSAEQVNDPTFRLNDLLQILHDRLENSSTVTETMNELMLVLGSRAALAAEALKEYDASNEGVQKSIDKVNALNRDQLKELAELHREYDDLGNTISNTWQKAVVGATKSRDLTGFNAIASGGLGASQAAQQMAAKQANPFVGLAEEAGKAAEQAAEAMKKATEDAAAASKALQAEMTAQELENMAAGVAAYREGSQQKLDALRREYDFAQQVYGSSQVDKVRAIYQQIIAEQRAVFDEQIRGSQEAMAAEDKHVQGVLRGYSAQIDANQRYLDESVQNQKQLDQLTEYSEDLQTRLMKERSQLLMQQRALEQRIANEWYQRWSGVAGAIESSFSGAISGMLQGTMTFSNAVRSIFSSVVDSLIQLFVKMGIQWAEGLIYQQVAQKATAISSITANSGIAATAAMASVAAIPFYGWAMAPEVGASTFAEGLAYLASASAAGGYDVPSNVNPVTQLHAREMVLPQHLADPIRDMAGGRKRGSAVNLNVAAADPNHYFVKKSELIGFLKTAGYQFKLA